MNWYGITKDGKEVMQSHENLLAWAKLHGLELKIEKVDYFVTPQGTRLVRGGGLNKMLETAINLGWEDLAEALFNHAQKK